MKNFLKRAGIATVVVGTLVAVGVAPRVAWADTTTLTFNFTANQIEGAPELTLYAFDGDAWTALEAGVSGNGVGVKVAGMDDKSYGLDLEDGARNKIDASRVSAVCNTTTNCTLSVSGVDTSLQSNGIIFVTAGDSPFDLYYTDHGSYSATTNVILEDTNFIIEYRAEEQHETFDGRAYAIWACGEDDDEVCLHLIEGIENRNGETEYYPSSTITDVTDATRKFDKFGAFEDEDYVRGMALATSVERWVRDYTGNDSATVADVDWSEVDIHQFLRGENKGDWERKLIEEGVCAEGASEEVLHNCVDKYFSDNNISEGGGVKLQPVGEAQGENSYTSYGDRNFRIAIYNENYRAIELGSLDDLYYVPSYYQDATFVDAIDVSGTTAETPAIMHSVLLENTLNIKAGEIGGLRIATLKAVELPDGAVTITKQDGGYKIVFNSNFFDAVVLEITDTSGAKYYLKVERSILDTYIREDAAWTGFTFDAATRYSDYELLATFVYEDGSSEQMIMENAQWIDDGLGNITYDFERLDGRNLKVATYKAVPKNTNWKEGLVGVYFNVRMAGSTETTYKGTLVGSGRGVFEPVPWGERR